MLAFDTTGAIDWGTRVIALATQTREHETLVHALVNVGTARFNAGDEQGRAELERAVHLATEAGFVDHAGRARTNLAWSALYNLDLAEAEQQLAAIGYATEYDFDNYRLYLLALRALLRRFHGAWDEALAIVQPLVQRPVLSPLTRIVALTVLGHGGTWAAYRRALIGGPHPLTRDPLRRYPAVRERGEKITIGEGETRLDTTHRNEYPESYDPAAVALATAGSFFALTQHCI